MSEQIKDFLDFIPSEVWVKTLNIIRRGRRNKRQEDLDVANDLLIPYLVDYGVWDGEEGQPTDPDFCDELWKYIKITTEEPETF